MLEIMLDTTEFLVLPKSTELLAVCQRITYIQGIFNCDILVSGVGGKRRPKEEMEGNGRERIKREKKCCFCLQNDLQDP